LEESDGQLVCVGPECGTRFPVIEGVPVLLNERNSVFRIADFKARRSTTIDLERSGARKTLARLIPSISVNLKAKVNYATFTRLLLERSAVPRVLVVGASILGEGTESLVQSRSLRLVETDVSFGPRTMLICDAHDIPFEDASFDGVVVQAVLEHVVDPYRCVSELHRVLNTDGLVYAETPFMQQVHMGRYDFTRFTHLGHRRLFREFDEIESGAVCGPGMALAWAYQHFLWSFTRSRVGGLLARAFARITAFPLKYFDYFLIDKPGALDAASACYFMGRKAGRALSDRDLVGLYRGVQV
jgi:SAM-dependent methyltransferase